MHFRQLSFFASLPLLALSACGEANPECDKLAAHITEVLSAEADGIPQEAKDKAIKDMTTACGKETPEKKLIDCAMKAQTRDALIACDKPATENEKS